MNRTSRADKNYFSCNVDTYTYYAGTSEAQTMGEEGAPISHGAIFIPDKPQDWDAVFKCSGKRNLHLTGMRVAQGRENALDQNNATMDCSFEGEFGVGGGEGDNVITVKGGSQRISYAGVIYSCGRNADYVQDAWSDQSSGLCSGIDLGGLKRADGQPVTIILGRFGSKIARYPSSYRVLKWKSLAYSLYWLGKWVAFKTGLI